MNWKQMGRDALNFLIALAIVAAMGLTYGLILLALGRPLW